jgi:hypothetical protein
VNRVTVVVIGAQLLLLELARSGGDDEQVEQAPMAARAEVQGAARRNQLHGVLHQGQAVDVEAELLEALEIGGVDLRVRGHVVATGLHERRENDGAADGAGERHGRALGAVGTALVAAGLVELAGEALEGVPVAEGATAPRRVERLQAAVIEDAHLFHAAHVRLGEYRAAGVPKALEGLATGGATAVHGAGVPVRRSGARPTGAPGGVFRVRFDRAQAGKDRAYAARRRACLPEGGRDASGGERGGGRLRVVHGGRSGEAASAGYYAGNNDRLRYYYT